MALLAGAEAGLLLQRPLALIHQCVCLSMYQPGTETHTTAFVWARTTRALTRACNFAGHRKLSADGRAVEMAIHQAVCECVMAKIIWYSPP